MNAASSGRAPHAILLGLSLFLAACGDGEGGSGGTRPLPTVRAEHPQERVFVDLIETVGTANANEQVTISSPVTERIERLYFDDGDFVRKGQLIALLAQDQEQASLASALATEEQARAQLERIQTLNDRGFATRVQLDTQTAALARARADADDARARIADRTVRAPLSGAVSLRTISSGSIVSVGDPIATVSDVSRIKLDFTLPEISTGSLRPGQVVEASSPAYPGVLFTGTVATIDPVIDASTRAITARALLPNPGGRLKPGMLLEVRIRSSQRSALAVPELSVIGEGDERFVYLLDNEDTVRRVAVKTGLRDSGYIEIAGVPAGARVVTEGVVKLADGMQVALSGNSAGKDS